ncbi:DUF4159 domain-containing protein [Candidatus Poribacteria bacterium]|nr:DUF4159 domain-containing protein [Candidatus Poribacteria bacterium]MYF55199.1 DUF4159 domain-containing protein [Candidatus Poribacteria bacterium]
MKYKKACLAIILLIFLITPLSIGEDSEYEFTFVRLKYNGSYQYRSLWYIDYPTADENLLFQLRKHTNIHVNPRPMVVEVGSHELFDYPFTYIAELGRLNLSKAEAENLREYLLRGGFIMTDDFHGTAQWKRFYKQYKKIFPKREPRDIPMTHPLFQCFYKIDKLMQIPAPDAYRRGRTYEKNGRPVRCMGVFDDKGRLMMMINFNTDLGDAWEHAVDSFYPQKFSNMAFKMGINAIVYTLTH